MREINDIVTGYRRGQALNSYQQAMLTGIAINAPDKFPKSLTVAFPELFPKKQQQSDWQLSKANMAAYAKAHNKKFKKAGKQNDG